MIKINEQLISEISGKGRMLARKRNMHNFHQQSDDPVQRMINAIEPWSYVRPHRHRNPEKREVFIILRGSLLVVEFNDSGDITDHVVLNSKNRTYGVEIPPDVWHTIISLETGTAVYELKDGPYIPITDKDFAAWAPVEGHHGTKVYIESVLKRLKL